MPFVKNKFIICLALAMLAVFTALYLWFAPLNGPHFLIGDFDPDYAYLFNSLNLATGRGPWHVDHPGVTAQLLGAGALWLTCFAAASGQTLTDAVLLNPELFMRGINLMFYSLFTLASLVFLWAGWKVFNKNRLLTLACASVPFFALAVNHVSHIAYHLSRLMPESLLWTSSLLFFAVFLLHFGAERDGREHWWLPCLYGLLSALTIGLKVTFFPLPLVAFILCLKRPRYLALFMASGALCFGLLTLPLWGRKDYIASWFSRLLTHSGQYGGGEQNFANWNNVLQAARFMLFNRGTYLAIMGLGLVALFTGGRTPKDSFWRRLLAAMLLASACSILISLKHFSGHYIMSVACMLPPMLFVSIHLLCGEKKPQWAKVGFAVIIVAILASGVYATGVKLHKKKAKLLAENSAWAVERENFAAAHKVYSFFGASKEFGLSYGNYFSGSLYDKDLERLYPASPEINRLYTSFGLDAQLGQKELPQEFYLETINARDAELMNTPGIRAEKVLAGRNISIYKITKLATEQK